MEAPIKRKVTARVSHISRPPSPSKYPASSSQLSASPSGAVRPKAKVNGALSRASSTRSAVSSTSRVANGNGGPSTATSTRASSPYKRTSASGPASPSPAAVKARLTARPTSKSVPGLSPLNLVPESAGAPQSGRSSPARRRRTGSLSLSHSQSSSTLSATRPVTATADTAPGSAATVTPSAFGANSGDLGSAVGGAGGSTSGNVRIKSKITNYARASAPPAPSLTPSSLYATTRPVHQRQRTPSITDIYLNSPQPPSSPKSGPVVYPITDCSPKANPHRYDPVRPPQYQYAKYQPFPLDHDSDVPPHSPPTSAVSFSSRSSTSKSSVSYHSRSSTAPTLHSHVNGLGATSLDLRHSRGTSLSRGALLSKDDIEEDENSESGSESESEHESMDEEERKVRQSAKSDRKIADLEIRNRSLNSINSTLEATKHRQAQEIRELRRKLREARLKLPPPAFQAVKSSLDHDDTAEDDLDETNSEEEEVNKQEEQDDPAFGRVKLLVEGLLESCKRALETTPEDFLEPPKMGAKVLSAEEVKVWEGRGDGKGVGDADEREDGEDNDHSETQPRYTYEGEVDSHLGTEDELSISSPSNGHIGMQDISSDSGSESGDDRLAGVSIPPITVSPSL